MTFLAALATGLTAIAVIYPAPPVAVAALTTLKTGYIRNCILCNNQADGDGGEVYNDDCNVYVYYSCFENGVNGSPQHGQQVAHPTG